MQATDSVQMELASALPVFPYCLETKRLTIRCPQPGDGPELHAALMDSIERLRAWFPWAAEAELTPEESETTARYIRWRFLTGKEFQFFLFLQRTNTVIGVCALCNPGWSTPQFEMSYWLRTGYEGQGYITEAVMAVTEFAFRTLGARRVEICCDSLNVGAIAVARRVGYVHEATLQRARQDQQSGEWRDVMIFAQEVK